MSLSCTVSEIWRDIGRKSPIWTYPTFFGATVKGNPVGILQRFLALAN